MSRRSAIAPPARGRRGGGPAGMTLVELLLATGLGLLLVAVVLRLLLLEGEQGARLSRLFRERTWQRRAVELIRADLRRAVALELGSAAAPACPMAGRQVVLHLPMAGTAPVTYALGPAPSPIWRGHVLLRCGPAFGLRGEPSPSTPQNRVLLDGLLPGGLRATAAGEGVLRLRIEQRFAGGGGDSQTILSEADVPAPLTR